MNTKLKQTVKWFVALLLSAIVHLLLLMGFDDRSGKSKTAAVETVLELKILLELPPEVQVEDLAVNAESEQNIRNIVDTQVKSVPESIQQATDEYLASKEFEAFLLHKEREADGSFFSGRSMFRQHQIERERFKYFNAPRSSGRQGIKEYAYQDGKRTAQVMFGDGRSVCLDIDDEPQDSFDFHAERIWKFTACPEH